MDLTRISAAEVAELEPELTTVGASFPLPAASSIPTG